MFVWFAVYVKFAKQLALVLQATADLIFTSASGSRVVYLKHAVVWIAETVIPENWTVQQS